MNESIRLPTGWAWSDLNSVCTKITDGTHHSPSQEIQLSRGDYLYITAKNIKEWGVDLSNVTYIPEHIHRQIYERCNPEQGDILYVKDGVTTGIATINQLDGEFSLLSSVALLKPRHEVIDARFLKWYLNSPHGYRSMTAQMGGTAIKRLTVKKIKDSQVPVAPLNEQRRIVERIEELLSDLDAGVSALERAMANLTRYRAAVLKAAVEGRLTEQWRAEHPDLEPASEILMRILAERRRKWEEDELARYEAGGRKPPQNWKDKYHAPPVPDSTKFPLLPKGWCWVTLSQIGWLDRGRSRHRPRNAPHLYGGPYPFIQTGDVRRANTFLREYIQTYSEAGLEQSKMWPAGTLCITIAANIAETAILSFDACFPDSIVGFLPITKGVSVRFVELFLRTVRQKLETYAPATAQKNINIDILDDISVPFPPLKEQEEITSVTDVRLSIIDATETQIVTNLKRAVCLRKNLLKRAFEGTLVLQQPTDEPASVLLERIRVQKTLEATQGKSKRTARRTNTMQSNGAKRSLLDVIREAPSGITPEELLTSANYSIDEVDLFYARLAEIKDDIMEQKPSEPEAYKWPYEAKVIIRSKG
jgi:type I restriction enzyme S subunit